MSLSSLTNRGRTTKRPGEVPTHLIALSVRSSRGRINNVDEEELILGQIDYYRQRAPEYDETSSPPGNPLTPHGQRIEDALHAFAPAGKVLEIASGTGTWTRHLLEHAFELAALDSSSEMHEQSRKKIRDERVRYIERDVFSWNRMTRMTSSSSPTGSHTYRRRPSSSSGPSSNAL